MPTRRLPSEFLKTPLAHRALHDVDDGRPENSIAAVKAAISAGYGIEIDVQLSSDAQAMVFHDYHLARLAQADGNIRDVSSAVLAGIPLRGGSEGVPTLQDVLAVVDGQVPLLIEIKDQDGQMGDNVGPLERSVSSALKEYSGPVAVMSFNPNSVKLMSKLSPDIPRGLVTDAFDPDTWGIPEHICGPLREITDYEAVEASFISHDRRDLERARVRELKAKGADILCWTVRSPQQEAQARKIAGNITFEGYLAPLDA